MDVNSADGAERVASSEAKKRWHGLLDRVSQARESIVITRYGKPIARLTPVESAENTGRGLVGCLAGTVTVRGDIVASTGEEWEADA